MSKRDRAAKSKAKADDVVDDAADAAVDTLDDAELRPTGKRAGTSRRARAEKSSASETATRRNPFAAIWTFLTQVVAEMKKVIWPTRRESIIFTIIVLIFIVIFTAFITGLDIGFAKLVLWIFGD
ncbi:preprotein translocase SecE subunit [Gordonia araii NBRC 100433]|uniref:Protein translocase subunit SecE n=1 Tax=Gordonia araii NBRC 100433 TaxID=1073574 RepID=G7H7F0_9ACTN|nr:preprotein translocase subunit SecE [Gordonia araii]NNG98458.1 preprotein translocase subunit SecE [Gordonia araii NBRC 100433]GAB11775.1 preprotein translocase SecE subunit [Gordonia araii NBRC 100433]